LPIAAALAALLLPLALIAGSRAARTAEAQVSGGSEELIQTTVTAAESKWRSCFGRELGSGPGVDSTPVTPAGFGLIEARLHARSGDWDVALLDARSGDVVAASAERDASEVAAGFVTPGQDLVLQACRLSGKASEAQVAVSLIPLDPDASGSPSLAFVKTKNRSDEALLQRLGLDLTEHGGENYVAVVLHRAADREALERVGLRYEIVVPDLARQAARHRHADARFARTTRSSPLPSGRDSYRRLADYQQEMKTLARDNPDLVRHFTLRHETWEGRSVEGIEITTDPNNLRDGKPVFLQMGLHHAREWPSGEHALEWAYELINGYRAGDQRVKHLVERTRAIIVPVVNPDGFNMSREAGERQGGGGGRGGSDVTNFARSPNEYRRKNCRLVTDSEAGNCAQPSVGLEEPGVDPNRNYGGLWGGPGASGPEMRTAQDYRGPGPFSEPETQNIQDLVSNRQVAVLITNHTYSNLVLREPGVAVLEETIDEPLYKALGDAMAAENGYASQYGYELYDTSGTTEDWTYYTAGAISYTFEIGCNHADPEDLSSDCIGNFHPPFSQVVDHYLGRNPEAQTIGGEGNREAYFLAHEAAADAAKHSLLTGTAAPGAVLELEKKFKTSTSPVVQPDGSTTDPIEFDDRLHSELVVPPSGRFEWHINPSTRPIVAQPRGRVPDGPPSEPIEEGGLPGPSAQPCGDFDTEDETCWNDHAFTVAGGPGVDNDSVTVDVDFLPPSDWDLKVFVDSNGDGSSVGETQQVAQSGNPPGLPESATFNRPQNAEGEVQPGQYVARVINFAAAEPYDLMVRFQGPPEFQPGGTESWTLSCTRGKRTIREQITIARGESQNLDLSRCQPPAKRRCAGRRATIAASEPGAKLVGTRGNDVIKAGKGRNLIRGRGGDDVVCGGRGNDVLRDSGGDDRLVGGPGRDRARGGGGKDRLVGGKHRDRLDGGQARDKLRGGGGRDKLNGGKGRDNCRGGKARDRLRSCERGSSG